MNGLFVTGTDTDVGKTVLCAALMAGSSAQVRYWKPVQTGHGLDDDSDEVARLAQLDPSRVWSHGLRYPLPASPHHAAAEAGSRIELEQLYGLAPPSAPGTRWIVEGAGGLLVPLNDRALWPAFIAHWKLPVLLASSTRLGTINHTLLTLEALKHRGFQVLGVVMMGTPDPSALSGIQAHTEVPIIGELDWVSPLTHDTIRGWGKALVKHPALHGLFLSAPESP